MLSIFKNKKNLILAYYFSWKICFIAVSDSCLYHLCFLVYVSVLAENLLILMENYSIWWKSLMKWSIMPWQRMTVLGKGGICKFLIPRWVVSECWKSWPMSLQGRCCFFFKGPDDRGWFLVTGKRHVWPFARWSRRRIQGLQVDQPNLRPWEDQESSWKLVGRIRRWLGWVDMGLSGTNQPGSFWW